MHTPQSSKNFARWGNLGVALRVFQVWDSHLCDRQAKLHFAKELKIAPSRFSPYNLSTVMVAQSGPRGDWSTTG